MKPARIAIAVAATLMAAWVFGGSDDGYKDLGDGLVMRADGTVVGVWDLPGCESQDDAFEVADVVVPNATGSRAIWRTRFDRGF
jgi:hypothetical protein